jgi:hypothetical protein
MTELPERVPCTAHKCRGQMRLNVERNVWRCPRCHRELDEMVRMPDEGMNSGTGH